MKGRNGFTWITILLITSALFWVACGNSQKKKEQKIREKVTEQPMDTVTFIESETIIEVDSIVPDSAQVSSKAE